MSVRSRFTAMVLGIALAPMFTLPTFAQSSGEAAAYETGTIQPAGPRQPPNGDNFLNIESSDNGTFASYGTIRFDLTALHSQFNQTFGSGGWVVTRVRLALTQANAGFTTDGAVDVYYSPDDDTDAKSPGSPLAWPFFDGQNSDLPATLVMSYNFIETNSGDVDTYTLFQTSGAGQIVADDIRNDTVLTLVLVDADPSVAATYRGQVGTMDVAPPTLLVDVMPSALPAELTDFTVSFGSLISGGLNDLRDSDNSRLIARSQFGISALEPNVADVVAGFQSMADEPNALTVTIESSVNDPAGVCKVRLRNWSTNLFQQIGTFPIGFTETVMTFEGVDATNRVQEQSSRVEVSARYVVIAPFSALGFEARIDQIALFSN